jgi:hypothetical protein
MAKKKTTTKLDATVKADRPGFKFSDTMPERKKSYKGLMQAFSPGGIATIWVRNFNETTVEFELVEREVMMLEKYPNCLVYEDEDGRKRGTPWWAIYDYELDAEGGPAEIGGEDQ